MIEKFAQGKMEVFLQGRQVLPTALSTLQCVCV